MSPPSYPSPPSLSLSFRGVGGGSTLGEVGASACFGTVRCRAGRRRDFDTRAAFWGAFQPFPRVGDPRGFTAGSGTSDAVDRAGLFLQHRLVASGCLRNLSSHSSSRRTFERSAVGSLFAKACKTPVVSLPSTSARCSTPNFTSPSPVVTRNGRCVGDASCEPDVSLVTSFMPDAAVEAPLKVRDVTFAVKLPLFAR